MTVVLRLLCASVMLAAGGSPAAHGPAALGQAGPPAAVAGRYVPDVRPLPSQSASELRDLVERYIVDRAGLLRRYSLDTSPERREVLRQFYAGWRGRLGDVDFDALGQDGRVDYVLLRNRLDYELRVLDRESRRLQETTTLLPFLPAIVDLHDARRRMEEPAPRDTAATLTKLAEQIDRTRQRVEAGVPASGDRAAEKTEPPEASKDAPPPLQTTKVVALRAAAAAAALRESFGQWFKYRAGYDPLFSWWTTTPYRAVDKALEGYVKALREKVVGIKESEDEPIVGDPLGREWLLSDLEYEMIAYTPEELVAIAHREFEWCESEMKQAARAMGLGDDWKAALERVKEQHVEPGRQPELIRDLAREAVEFVDEHRLVTVPPLARDIWRMEMMSPEQQKVNPFFLGGEVIRVSYPTDTMDHDDKLMSMRGNNRHFARATVFHELIPGHHLQGFMTDRYNTHRRAFSTPFWGEGWALYMEMLFWDLGFPRSPEDRIGMLFWRMHRAARIIFSLSFHLGKMSPQECIEFLVDRVGHERANAEGEVRRSFNGSYAPLYQVAYMVGGLQLRALHAELVGSGRLTNRELHDRVLTLHRIPIELVRASLTAQPLTRDHRARWKFAGETP